MRRHVWLAAALTVAWAGMAASAQEKRVGRCGTGDLLAAMEWEAARTAAEEAAAKTVMEKGRMTVPSREKKGLVLHYAFGKGAKWETGSVVKDLSGGGHDGRVEGDGLEVVRGIGKQGKAVRFDGKVDYIRVPRDEALEPDEITVAAWVKIRAGENLTESGTLVFKRNSSFHDNESYGLAVYPNRIVRADVSSPRCGHNRVDSSVPMAPGVWHHVAMAFRGGETRLYLDGVLVATGSYPPALDHNAGADLLVGVRDHAEYPMGRFGAFDLAELRIWDEALDGERVAALYRERADRCGVAKREIKGKKGPILHYAFGKGGAWGTGSVVKDLSGGGHDGRVEGDGLEVAKGMGHRGKAARFDGNGDFIRVPRSAAFEGQEVSVAAWVKVREGAQWENGSTIAFKRNASSSHNEGYHLEIFPDRTVRAVASGPNASQCRVQSTVPLSDEEWHHVAMVHAQGDTRLYIDGVLEGRGAYPNAVEHNAEADLLIGGRDHAQYPVDLFAKFDLAEVKVWNRALEDGEMAGLYREKEGGPGVGRSGSAGTALVECGSERKLSWRGIEHPPRKFPAWTPGTGKFGGTESAWVRELRELVAQGRRDRAASPEFLGALEGLVEKYGGTEGGCVGKPSAQLPLKPAFWGPGMPAGWRAVEPTVWRFGDGEARQVESKANTRYALFYGPGMTWKDYEVTLRFESDKWFPPPANSGAELYVRYKRVDDAFRLDWNGNGYLSVISCEAGGRERAIARVPVGAETIRDGKPWTVRVRGDEIVVEHEGKRQLEVHDSMHREGTVGLESIHIPVKFGGLEVR